MKKLISLAIAILMFTSSTVSAFADTANDDFDLIEYVEVNNIDSRDEVIAAIEENTGVELHLDEIDGAAIVSTEIETDHENNLVYVVTTTSEFAATTATSKTYSASSKKEVFSGTGALLYTISISAKFKYTSGVSCSVSDAAGNFKASSGSLWKSTPKISSGKITTKKAYAQVSGTAKTLLQSQKYTLKMVCDSTGKVTSNYSEA